MGVYLYPNNTETELKNAYIGEYGYTYSYDFTTWSIADFTSKWWTVPSSCGMSSNWLYTTTNSRTTLTRDNNTELNNALQSANTVKIQMVWRKTSSAWEHYFWILNGSSEYGYVYGNSRYVGVKAGNIMLRQWSAPLISSDTLTLNIDLVGMSASYTTTWNGFSGTSALSASDITAVKSCNKMNIYIDGNNNNFIESISIIVK